MIVAAVVTAVAAIVAALLGIVNRRKIAEVHVLVNSQLTEVMTRLETITAERDVLRDREKK